MMIIVKKNHKIIPYVDLTYFNITRATEELI